MGEADGPKDTVVGDEKKVTLDPSAEGRFDIWEKALEMFKSNPIMGMGFRNFSYIYGYDTHNNYLKTLAEQGLVGFSIYIFLYLLAFRSGLGLYRGSKEARLRGLGLGFAGCVIANMFANLTHDNWSYINLMGLYWIFWGLAERGRKISCAGLPNTMVEGSR